MARFSPAPTYLPGEKRGRRERKGRGRWKGRGRGERETGWVRGREIATWSG